MRFPLLKKLQLARKAFLTHAWRVHFSQHGEDIILAGWTHDRPAGFYVDVGCWHPKKFSNTYALYKRGWSGINIDIDADKIACFNLARPRDTNVVAAVSDSSESMEVYSDGKFSLATTLDASQSANPALSTRRRVMTTTLTEILDASAFRDRPIDLLTVDVEGFDSRVLRGLDFHRYRPRIVLVELFAHTIEQLLQSEIHRLMTDKGYWLRNWVGVTAFYERIH